MMVVFAGNQNVSVRLFQFNAGWKMRLHLPFGPLHHNGVAFYFKLHSLRERNRFLSDTRHFALPFS
jgi:hypothetical protein